METGRMKLALSAGAIALSMALAGCGGGSNPVATGDDPQTTENVTTPLAAAQAAVEAAEMAVKALETDPDAAKIAAAERDIATAEEMVAALDDGDEKDALVATLDGLKADDGTLAMAKTEVEGATAEQVAEMNARAAGLHEALTISDGSDDIFTDGPGNAELGVTPVRIQGTVLPATGPDIVITRNLSGSLEVERDRDGWQGEATDAAPLGGTGWAGKVLTHSGEEQTITVYSDIANAVRADFSADDGSDPRRPRSIYNNRSTGDISYLPNSMINAASPPSTPARLTITQADMNVAYQQGLLDIRFFPAAEAPNGGSRTYTYRGEQGPRAFRSSFPGTFHGAQGMYECTTSGASDCQVTIHPATITTASRAVFSAGTWNFTPDQELTPNNPGNRNDAQLVAQDTDWLSFGWWVSEPKTPVSGGVFEYDAQVFYRGSDRFPFTSISALERTNATYAGRAAGLYARTAGEDRDAERGEFTANASLTARFGMGSSAPRTANIGGTIDQFTNDDGVDMSEWKLTLVRTPIVTLYSDAGNGVITGRIESATTGTIGAGEWQAELYGPDSRNRPPSGVAGRFSANIDANTAVAGGFGASR